MAKHRTHRKIERSPQDAQRLQSRREAVQQTRPTLDELIGSGDYWGPISHGDYLETKQIAVMLKAARSEAGLSLTEVSDATGIDRSAISRLENGLFPNTTINTLNRLANAYGKHFVFRMEDAPQAVGE